MITVKNFLNFPSIFSCNSVKCHPQHPSHVLRVQLTTSVTARRAIKRSNARLKVINQDDGHYSHRLNRNRVNSNRSCDNLWRKWERWRWKGHCDITFLIIIVKEGLICVASTYIFLDVELQHEFPSVKTILKTKIQTQFCYVLYDNFQELLSILAYQVSH